MTNKFILINLIGCSASQSTNALMFFFHGPFRWPIFKNITKSPLIRNHMFSIVLHLHCFTWHKIDLYNFIFMCLVLYIYIYIYTNVVEY
jgi:hypothetical protein